MSLKKLIENESSCADALDQINRMGRSFSELAIGIEYNTKYYKEIKKLSFHLSTILTELTKIYEKDIKERNEK